MLFESPLAIAGKERPAGPTAPGTEKDCCVGQRSGFERVKHPMRPAPESAANVVQQVVDELVNEAKCTHQNRTVNVRDVAKNDGTSRFDRNLFDCQHVRFSTTFYRTFRWTDRPVCYGFSCQETDAFGAIAGVFDLATVARFAVVEDVPPRNPAAIAGLDSIP